MATLLTTMAQKIGLKKSYAKPGASKLKKTSIHKLPKGLRFKKKAISRHAVGITAHMQRAGYETYIVGGCVRDLLVNRKPKDFDIGTVAWPKTVKNLVKHSRIIGRRFRLVHVPRQGEIFEIATFRRESNEEDEEKGRDLGENYYGTAEQDAWRRDFTVNALFYDPVNEELVDYVGGLEDLQKGIIRSIGDPAMRFEEDPIRIIRAVRFSSIPDFRLGPGLKKAMKTHAHQLKDVNRARLREEILKLMKHRSAAQNFKLCQETQLLCYLFPELDQRWSFRDENAKQGAARRFLLALDETDLGFHFVVVSSIFVFLARKAFLAESEERIPPYEELVEDENLIAYCTQELSISHAEREKIFRALGLASEMQQDHQEKKRKKIAESNHFESAFRFLRFFNKVYGVPAENLEQWQKLFEQKRKSEKSDGGRLKSGRGRGGPGGRSKGRGRGRGSNAGSRTRKKGSRYPVKKKDSKSKEALAEKN
jgi:poly(A) polymerase